LQLPNGDKAVIDERKLWGYALNPGHPHGSQHATLFKHLLGIDLSNWRLLSAELARAARSEDATIGKTSSYGEKYEIRFPMTGPRGRYNPECVDHSERPRNSGACDGLH
jgi:hypothetical protein